MLAQNSVLRGIVTDESGAVVPGATVTVTGGEGFAEQSRGYRGPAHKLEPLSARAPDSGLGHVVQS